MAISFWICCGAHQHWELDADGQPTQRIIASRRPAEFTTPIPPPRKRKPKQRNMVFDDLSTEDQHYDMPTVINDLRNQVDQWRSWPNSADWKSRLKPRGS